MIDKAISSLQAAVGVQESFTISDYFTICYEFLNFIEARRTTRIISPFASSRNYIFFNMAKRRPTKLLAH